jgi:asparagine synthetase B (glutamine-hydrolysing)
MCGIAGIKRYGTDPISVAEIEILICTNEIRGNHASGIALAQGDKIVIHKMPVPAWSFIRDNSTKAFLAEHLTEETETVLLHTRFATVGNPNKNQNNHPMFDGKVALVHNGGIRNADFLFKEDKYPRFAETDSDILRAIIAQHGFTAAAARQLARCSGSGAIAALSCEYPGHLLLGRSGNPLVVAHANDKLYFASTLAAIQKAVRPWEIHHGMFMRGPSRNFAYNNMADHTCYILKPDDTATHHEMNIAGSGFVPPVYRSHDNYAEKMQVFQSAKSSFKVYTYCRECGTGNNKFSSQEWKNLKCRQCGESFSYLTGVPISA